MYIFVLPTTHYDIVLDLIGSFDVRQVVRDK